MDNQKTQDESQPKIKRARVDSLNLYEVTDGELELIEKGSPSSIYLNFAVALLSMAVSFLIALLTAKIESLHVFCIFIIICASGFIFGIILFVLWYRNRNDFVQTIKRIKDRLKTE